MNALAHFGPAVANLDTTIATESHNRTANFPEAIAKTRIFHTNREPDGTSG